MVLSLLYFYFATCRSMPTSAALDVVAKALKLKFFEVLCGLSFVSLPNLKCW